MCNYLKTHLLKYIVKGNKTVFFGKIQQSPHVTQPEVDLQSESVLGQGAGWTIKGAVDEPDMMIAVEKINPIIQSIIILLQRRSLC